MTLRAASEASASATVGEPLMKPTATSATSPFAATARAIRNVLSLPAPSCRSPCAAISRAVTPPACSRA
jgi:hypothetical protein